MIKTDTKTKILNSTLDLIDEKPFPEVRTKEIAENAGISEPTIFRHFSNKNSILHHLVENFINLITQIDFSDVNNEQEFRYQLINFFKETSNINFFKRKLMKFILYIGMYKQDTFFTFVKMINMNFFEPIEKVVEVGKSNWGYDKNLNTKVHVRLFVNSIYFFLIQQKVFRAEKIEKYDFDEIITTAVNNFLKSLK